MGRNNILVIDKGQGSCWSRRSGLERWLIALSAVLICAALIIAIISIGRSSEKPCPAANVHNSTGAAYGLTSNGELSDTSKRSAEFDDDGNALCANGSTRPKLCCSDACIHAASRLIKNMDRSTHPCDDFYQFACGQFRKNVAVPEEKGQISTLGLIDDHLEQQLHDILTKDVPPPHTEPPHITNIRNMFALCMNKSKIESEGTAWLEDKIRKAGGWPLLEGADWDEDNFNWLNAIYTFRHLGYSVPYLIEFSVISDFKNSSRRIVNLDQALTTVNREYLVEGFGNKIVTAYMEYMMDIAVMMGAKREDVLAQCREVIQFEIQLANASLSEEERRDVTKLYNLMTISEAQHRFPDIPWKEYINEMLPKHKVQVTDEDTIVINDIGYIEQLGPILKKTTKRTLANYIMWSTVRYTLPYFPERFTTRALQYSSNISGRKEQEPRWKECTSSVNGGLVIAFGSLYVRKFFDKDSKKVAVEITNNIKEEMYKTLETVDWMDNKTRQSALDKMKAMTAYIAYPEELIDDQKLAEFYSGLEVRAEGPYVEAVVNVTKFETDFDSGRLREIVNKTEWLSHGSAAVVNAYYSSTENSIEFPAAILQGAFFTGKRPRYMNYGTFGFVVAHEITHGFDDRGRLFDKDGNLFDWWDPETKKRFMEKSECIIHQYGNYTDSQVNMKLNGINTQGENIADNGGIKQAYRAYTRWVKENGEEVGLPGLQQYTPRQLFWISAANSWCSVYRDEDLANRITTDTHSPSEYRVIGSISNMPEFSEDFGCPLGTKMNPVHKCNVW